METARALFDGDASGDNEKRDLLIITGTADAALNADGVPQGAAPVLMTNIGPGEDGTYISAMPTGGYKTISTKHILHGGLNILHVAVPEPPPPAAEIVSVNQAGRHRYKIEVRPVKDAGRYVLRIEAADTGPSYPGFEELVSNTPRFSWTDPGRGKVQYRLRAAAYREQGKTYSGMAADWSDAVQVGGSYGQVPSADTADSSQIRAKNAAELDITSWTAFMAAPFLFNQCPGTCFKKATRGCSSHRVFTQQCTVLIHKSPLLPDSAWELALRKTSDGRRYKIQERPPFPWAASPGYTTHLLRNPRAWPSSYYTAAPSITSPSTPE